MEQARYFVCRVRLGGTATFVVWSTGDKDDFVRDERGRLLTAGDAETLAASAAAREIDLEADEPTDYDFDRLQVWCSAPEPGAIDCSAFLNAWNFFDDLFGLHRGTDTPYTRASRDAAACYDKLFWGNNLPAVTPPGEHFVPVWDEEEMAEIRSVFLSGLALLDSEFRVASSRVRW